MKHGKKVLSFSTYYKIGYQIPLIAILKHETQKISQGFSR